MQTTMKRDVAKPAIIFLYDISLKRGISFFDEELNGKKLGLFFMGFCWVFPREFSVLQRIPHS